jgi:hypothetical protein
VLRVSCSSVTLRPAPPRILEYRGSGDLRAWLRVTAMRAAPKLSARENSRDPTDDALEACAHE